MDKSELATERILKASATIIISIILSVVAYFVLTKYSDKLFFPHIIAVSNGAIEAISDFAINKLNMSLKFLENENLYLALQVYWVASFPFGYYFLTKLMGIGLLAAIIKLILSAFISPIIMPIALIISIINIIRSAKILKKEWNTTYDD